MQRRCFLQLLNNLHPHVVAVIRKDITMIHVLVDKGVDPRIAANNGKTCVDISEEIPDARKRVDVLVALFKTPPTRHDTLTPISVGQ